MTLRALFRFRIIVCRTHSADVICLVTLLDVCHNERNCFPFPAITELSGNINFNVFICLFLVCVCVCVCVCVLFLFSFLFSFLLFLFCLFVFKC